MVCLQPTPRGDRPTDRPADQQRWKVDTHRCPLSFDQPQCASCPAIIGCVMEHITTLGRHTQSRIICLNIHSVCLLSVHETVPNTLTGHSGTQWGDRIATRYWTGWVSNGCLIEQVWGQDRNRKWTWGDLRPHLKYRESRGYFKNGEGGRFLCLGWDRQRTTKPNRGVNECQLNCDWWIGEGFWPTSPPT